MKKFTILAMALLIGASALGISTSYAATDAKQALATGTTESDLLTTLMKEGMSLLQAAQAIINAGGDLGSTVVAAIAVDSNFSPASVAPASASGPSTGGNVAIGSNTTTTLNFTFSSNAGGIGGGGGGTI